MPLQIPSLFRRFPLAAAPALLLAGCALLPKDEGIEAAPSARAVQVVNGSLHTCALTDKGRVRCWGQNDYGQVGTDDPRYYERPESDPIDVHTLINTPMEIKDLEGVTAIATSGQANFNCAIVGGGEVRCWGLDALGQLGTGVVRTDTGAPESGVPVAVAGLSGVKAIAVGESHACALTASGGVMCWGSNAAGQLGDGSPIQQPGEVKIPFSNKPVAVVGLTGAVAIAAGYAHSCAITSAGGLVCWGDNSAGQSGGDALVEMHPENLPTPTPVLGFSSGVARVFMGVSSTCVTMTSGEARCFGIELGLGSAEQLSRPEPIAATALPELAPLQGLSLEMFNSHVSCAVVGGAARCWGDNYYACLGASAAVVGDDIDYGYTTWIPTEVHGLGAGVRDVTVGGGHVCALLENGAVKCWGDRLTGNGDESGTRLPSGVPQNVVSLP